MLHQYMTAEIFLQPENIDSIFMKIASNQFECCETQRCHSMVTETDDKFIEKIYSDHYDANELR